jgi:hypothetical protein
MPAMALGEELRGGLQVLLGERTHLHGADLEARSRRVYNERRSCGSVVRRK